MRSIADVDRLLEGDHYNAAGDADFGFHFLGELEHERRIAAGNLDPCLALDGLGMGGHRGEPQCGNAGDAAKRAEGSAPLSLSAHRP